MVPNWLGDAVLAIPAVRGLLDCERRGRVVTLASTMSAEIYSRMPGTLVFPLMRPGGGALDSLKAMRKAVSVLRSYKPVFGFSLTKSFTSSFVFWMGRVPRRFGFVNSSFASLYTDRLTRSRERNVHLIDSYCSLMEGVGIRIENRIPRLDATERDLAAGHRVMTDHGLDDRGFVCLFPGARYGPAKRWEIPRFALLGDLIVDRFKHKVVLLGSREDLASCDSVEQAMARGCLNLCGKLDFPTLIGTLKFSRAAISNDSGGMHLAAALGIPLVGLFFSTDPAWTAPRSAETRVLYRPTDCSPCFQRDCKRGHVCTQSIGVEDVLTTLSELGVS
jgi:heptosyltransferase-2